jgi:hypothetical protein
LPREAQLSLDTGKKGEVSVNAPEKDYLLAVGGSTVSGLSTPASDLDLFLVAAPGDEQAALRPLLEFLPPHDLEVRTLEWLSMVDPKLRDYSPPVNAGLSPFSWMDLRFLARIVRGRILYGRGNLIEQIRSLEEPLRRALVAYVGTLYVMRYQDAYGLVAAGQSAYGVILAGELAQHACLLAALQLSLVDPSPKWAPQLAENLGSKLVCKNVQLLMRHLRKSSEADHKGWLVTLLNLSNAVIVAAIIEKGSWNSEDARGWQDEPVVKQLDDPRLCIMGVPGYLTLVDSISNKIFLANESFFFGLLTVGAEG